MLFAATSLGLLAACGPTAQPLAPARNTPTVVSHSGNGPVQDLVSLVDALRAKGLTSTPAGTVSQPFLNATGYVHEVNGQPVRIFEYADVAAAGADAGRIQPDATVLGTMITWVGQPHFYRAGRIIVLYVGQDATVLQALEATLGAPFAVGSEASAASDATGQDTPAGSVTQPFLSVSGTRYQIGANDLQVYQYPDAKGPEFDSEQIQPDGMVTGMQTTWIAPPHFYKRGLLLVIYLGEDAQVLQALEALLGPPFASATAKVPAVRWPV